MKRKQGIELDVIISVPCSQGTNMLPRTRSEVKAAANKRLLRTRSEVKAAKQTGYVETPAETTEATELPDYYCDICMETKNKSDMFQSKIGCRHLFCSDCVGKHVESKIKENMTIVTCPSPRCRREIVPEVFQTIVSKEIQNQWKKALSELNKFKCPYKDCSEMLLDHNRKNSGTTSKCPRCKQLYCPHCKVVWHSKMGCTEFQSLEKGDRQPDDLLLMKLAKKNRWQRCPTCMFYIERHNGCREMNCRCGCTFCYKCGEKYGSCTCSARHA